MELIVIIQLNVFHTIEFPHEVEMPMAASEGRKVNWKNYYAQIIFVIRKKILILHKTTVIHRIIFCKTLRNEIWRHKRPSMESFVTITDIRV